MPSPLFYIFAAIMLAGGTMVVCMRNPVSSALSMVVCFLGLAALFVGLNAYLIGILQILVYAGAIMVLFIFIIMLLDLKKEEKTSFQPAAIAAGVVIPLILVIQLAGVLNKQESHKIPELQIEQAAANFDKDTMIHKRLKEGRLPDTHLIGEKLYTDYNFPLQMIAVLLLVATVGCVTLSKKNGTAKSRSSAALPEPTKQGEPEAKPTQKKTKNPANKDVITDEKLGLIYTAAPEQTDDLKAISGVGPVLESKLNDFGIYTFKQIAEWTDENITEFDSLLSFKGRITREDWLTQAAELSAKENS